MEDVATFEEDYFQDMTDEEIEDFEESYKDWIETLDLD